MTGAVGWSVYRINREQDGRRWRSYGFTACDATGRRVREEGFADLDDAKAAALGWLERAGFAPQPRRQTMPALPIALPGTQQQQEMAR